MGDKLGKAEAEDITVLYWLDGPLAFAMAINAAEPKSDHLARVVREAIGTARLNDEAAAMVLSPASPGRPQDPGVAAGEVRQQEGPAMRMLGNGRLPSQVN